MVQSVKMMFDAPSRMAYLAHPKVIRAFVPSQTIGVYILYNEGKPIYVGRSDSCIQTRLCGHELLCKSTHFSWEPCSSPKKAYLLEALWYHKLQMQGQNLNQIHPGKPAGWIGECPFCTTAHETIALQAAGISVGQRY